VDSAIAACQGLSDAMHAAQQPCEEAPLLEKPFGRDDRNSSSVLFGPLQDSGARLWPPQRWSPSPRAAVMRRSDDSSTPTAFAAAKAVTAAASAVAAATTTWPARQSGDLPGLSPCGSDDDRPSPSSLNQRSRQNAFGCSGIAVQGDQTAQLGFMQGKDVVIEGGDMETDSTTTGQLSRSTIESLIVGRPMPWQRQARRFYKWLLPFALAELFALCAPAAYMYWHLERTWSSKGWRILLASIPDGVAIGIWLFGLTSVVVQYAYHFVRLRGSAATPDCPGGEPLTHVVIVCSYKEPYDVLGRTFSSLAGQRGLRQPPIVVFAAEARDPSWRASFEQLRQAYGHRLKQLWWSEHVLVEDEIAGKAANENFAAREVFRILVEEHGLNPFEVMLSIVDADSVLSPTYLAHVEAAFRAQPDGRRLVYNGPLNVYRNFAEGCLSVQCLELARCHQDTFHSPFTVPYPFSNYSLTLGFAAEIGFWTPDVMPEDIHTVNKAMVNSFGSRTTVTIPAFICNDLVAGFGDRYQQAKRHQWGSVTELAWLAALFQDMGLRFPAWWAIFTSEATRAGSFISTIATIAQLLVEASLGIVLTQHWADVPSRAKFLLSLTGSYMAWQWLWFWIAEIALWQTLLQQFPIEHPSPARWVALILSMPTLHGVNRVVFLILPTVHALCLRMLSRLHGDCTTQSGRAAWMCRSLAVPECRYHAVFVGELAYVCAPKGVLRPCLEEANERSTSRKWLGAL